MKRFLIILFTLFLLGCKPTEQVIVHHEYVQHVVDSVRWHDSTVVVPIEVWHDIAVIPDTLHLETSLAIAEAWLDSCFLQGTIKNKQQVIYKYIEVEKVRDSVVYEKVPEPYPVEVEVEKPLNKKLRWWAIISTIGLGCSLVYIFRKPLLRLILHTT